MLAGVAIAAHDGAQAAGADDGAGTGAGVVGQGHVDECDVVLGRCVGSCDVDVEQLGPPPDCGGVDRPDRHQTGRGAGRRAVDEHREDVVGAGRDGDDRRARCADRHVPAGAVAAEDDDRQAAELGQLRSTAPGVERRTCAGSVDEHGGVDPGDGPLGDATGVACHHDLLCAGLHGGDRDPPQHADLGAVGGVADRRVETADVTPGPRVDDDADAGHAGQAPSSGRASASRTPAAMRAASGTYLLSSAGVNGTGEYGAATRPTGASR